MTNARAKLVVRDLYRSVIEWAERPQNREFLLERPREELARDTDLGSTMTNLQMLSLWYRAQAVVEALADRDPAAALATSQSAAVLESRVAAQSFALDTRRKRRFRLWRSETALHACQAFAGQWFDDAHELGRLLADDVFGLLNIDTNALASFVQGLARAWDGNMDASAAPNMPREYQALLFGWNGDSATVSELLRAACDVRLAWAEDDEQKSPLGELGDMVFALYPVELLAVLRLREIRGLDSPTCDHPLFEMPMGRLRTLDKERSHEPILSELDLRLGLRA